MLSSNELSEFRADLLKWFARQKRDLPWRRTRDPYAIWISEIMLQQTRVAAVIPYYERFLARFPAFEALAAAGEAELLAAWAGLGYYYRAHNLRKAARMMRDSGAFPSCYEEMRRLPGIGDYTAAAIASIAFELPHAVLDGNVLRVLSRVLGDETNIACAAARKHFAKAANELLDRTQPGTFNQAMMELGATVCLPSNPQCLVCPVARWCRACARGAQNELPVKIRERKIVQEHRTVFWIERQGRVLLWRRPAESRLMPGFWELPETEQLPGIAGRRLGSFRHGITFHRYLFDVQEASTTEIGVCEWVPLDELERLPMSTIARKTSRVVEKCRAREAEAAAASVASS
jgi:A/G-specific adenine glycosylase